MFRGLWVVLTLLAGAAAAQEVEPGRWSFGLSQYRGAAAYVTGRTEDGETWHLSAACETVDVSPPQAPDPEATAVLTFTIDGEVIAAAAKAEVQGEAAVWVAELTEDLSEALAGGNFVTVFAPEGSVRIGLTGSMRTLAEMHAACDAAKASETGAMPAVDPEEAEDALRDYLAGACGEAAPEIGAAAILSRDLTADGRPDHVIDWSQVSCPDGAATGRCDDEEMCAAEIWVAPALPPDPPSDTFQHAGLELWPDRHVAIRTRSVRFTEPLHWRWGGEEFLGSIPYNP